MFGRGVTLFKLFGFPIRIDASWIIIAVLVSWSLAAGLFPLWHEGLASTTYWAMGIAGALGLFVSILLHELAHSVVARNNGLPIRGITLFVFGGVAEMTEEPESPRVEFLMAIAGPAASLAIAAGSFGLFQLGVSAGWPVPAWAVLRYLAFINGLLVVFNMLPAFPLDGGRVLRSLLWGWKGNLRWATRVASWFGSAFGLVLMVLGVLSLLTGNLIGGVWWFVIGLFLRNAAQMGYQQVLIRHALEGEPVRRFMRDDPVTVAPGLTITQLVEDYVYRHHYKMFPVVEGEDLIGCVSLKQIKELPREAWDTRTVSELAQSCSPDNTISPRADALKALSKMNRTKASRLMVVEDGRLYGILALKDLLEFFSLKVELEE